MRFKYLLTLLIFSFMLSKESFAILINKNSDKSNHSYKSIKKHKKLRKTARKKDYMHGIASYYGKGDGFDGKKMADGERFNANNMFVAAHPILPLGTKLKVIDNRSGKVIYVEIKDRMPRGNRIIDLSYAAAVKLGIEKKGLSYVTLVKIDNAEFFQKKREIIQNKLSNTKEEDIG